MLITAVGEHASYGDLGGSVTLVKQRPQPLLGQVGWNLEANRHVAAQPWTTILRRRPRSSAMVMVDHDAPRGLRPGAGQPAGRSLVRVTRRAY
jgi:hypothetical protein